MYSSSVFLQLITSAEINIPTVNLTNRYYRSAPDPINLWPLNVSGLELLMFAGARLQVLSEDKWTEEVWIHIEVKGQVLLMKKGQREEHEWGERYWSIGGQRKESQWVSVWAGLKHQRISNKTRAKTSENIRQNIREYWTNLQVKHQRTLDKIRAKKKKREIKLVKSRAKTPVETLFLELTPPTVYLDVPNSKYSHTLVNGLKLVLHLDGPLANVAL